jgi:FkbM family methyltransferase
MNQILLQASGKIARLVRWTGFGWLLAVIRDSMDSIFMKIDKPPLQIEINGVELHGYLRHRSFLEYLAAGDYSPFTQELYKKALKPGVMVVDGGAHIGLYSLLAMQRLASTDKIFAFEPDPYNFRALAFNVNHNHGTNVVLMSKAISNSTSNTFFYTNSGTISSSLFDRKDRGMNRPVIVQCTTLDNELQDLAADRVVIRLNIEGAEPLALDGMHQVLQKARSAVLIAEVNPSALLYADLTQDYMFTELRKMGFQISFIDELEKRLIPINSSTFKQKGNIYCIKKNKV